MTPRLSFPGDDVEFVDVIETAKKTIKELQEQDVDVIVAYTHLNNKEDKSLARHCPEINLILGGHVHEPYAETEGGTLVMKCGQNAYWLGRVDLRVEITNADKEKQVRADHSFNFILNMDFEADKDIQSMVDEYRVDVTNPDAQVPLYIGSDLESYSGVCRTKESTMGSLVADAMRHMTGSDLAVINGGFIRGDKSYPEGYAFTRADVATELPFESPATVIKIKGEHILLALEQQLAFAPTKNGAFPQLSGFRIEYKESNKPGERILAAYLCPEHGNVKFRGGKDDSVLKKATREIDFSSHVPLDLEAEYSICITKFLFEGGDGLTGYTFGHILEGSRSDTLIVDLLFEYLTLEDGDMLLSPSLEEHRVWNKDEQ
eukprot:TRINITY_DN1636_c0_g1_i1.p1 TRINITY_DN1636_c0_g1~~TRINITY_DN1636_c0_g1_i1.p1  ORF type:complete len:375 (-),score=112.36 TRINITY_DN1636_c0_g1_i1:75-1199(-)